MGSNFKAIQQRFFDRIAKCCNPTEVTIQFIALTSTGGLSDFTGDSHRAVASTLVLGCFYQRYLNDKQREKAGVTEEVTMSVFISPLELEKKYGNFDFPAHVRSSYSKIAIQIFGQHHEIESIRDLEPQQREGKLTVVAYQINLKTGKGNTDFN